MVKFKRNTIGKVFGVYECPHCDASLRSPVEEVGIKDICPECENEFYVPGAQELEERNRQEKTESKGKNVKNRKVHQTEDNSNQTTFIPSTTKNNYIRYEEKQKNRYKIRFLIHIALAPISLVAAFIILSFMMYMSGLADRTAPLNKQVPNAQLKKDNVEVIVKKDDKKVSIYDYLKDFPNDIKIKDTDSDVLKKAKTNKQIEYKEKLLKDLKELYLEFTFNDSYVKDAEFRGGDRFYSVEFRIPSKFKGIGFRHLDDSLYFPTTGNTAKINQEVEYNIVLHIRTDIYEKSFKNGKRIEVRMADLDIMVGHYFLNEPDFNALIYVNDLLNAYPIE